MNSNIETSSLFNVETEDDTRYTSKINIPQYLPSVNCPSLAECFNDKKYKELWREINNSTLEEEEKNFLKLAATRHIVFNYGKIADYYAHASKEMQELMEKSALVIIDINDAIANGYVKLTKTINKIMEQSGRQASEEYHNQARDTRKKV